LLLLLLLLLLHVRHVQLVQALRFEAFDDSRLARFLVARAAANPAFAIFLHW
jgi:phosphatidylinositol 3-kinase